MSDAQIAKYHRDLLDKIPISVPMGVRISHLSEGRVEISAPLQANINYQGTAFGGSLNAIAILTCYLMLHHLLVVHGVKFKTVVIQRGEIDFLRPVQGNFVAVCELPSESKKFLRDLQEKGRGRLELDSEIRLQGEDVGARVRFHGVFIAKT